MGVPFVGKLEQLMVPDNKSFSPSFTRNRDLVRPPEIFRFQELMLQTALRHQLQDEEKLGDFLKSVGYINAPPDSLEVLGEKALTHGHIDLLLKQRIPLGSSLKIPLEVKMNRGQPRDVIQLRGYMDELGECATGVLIAADFGRDAASKAASLGIMLVRYALNADLRRDARTFDEIWRGLSLQRWGS